MNISYPVICKQCNRPMSIRGNNLLKISYCDSCDRKIGMNDVEASIINWIMKV
jgi:hypothetical protein